MSESLFSKECESIFQSCLSPSIFGEIIFEKSRHFLIFDGSIKTPNQTFLLHSQIENGGIQWVLRSLERCFCNFFYQFSQSIVISNPPSYSQFPKNVSKCFFPLKKNIIQLLPLKSTKTIHNNGRSYL